MSKIDFQELNKIHQYRKDTVIGWIRNDEALKDHEIPDEILFMCILFYGNKISSLMDVTDDEYFYILNEVIKEINIENKMNKFVEIDRISLVNHFKEVGLMADKFVECSKKKFQEYIDGKLRLGTTTKLYYWLKKVNIVEKLEKRPLISLSSLN